jgi:large subunit ribosomal protein L15
MPLHRRLPKRGFRSRNRIEYAIVNLEQLAELDAGTTVDLTLLQERGIAKKGRSLLKVLANGDLGSALTIRAHKFSASAAAKIAAAGGTAELIEN